MITTDKNWRDSKSVHLIETFQKKTSQESLPQVQSVEALQRETNDRFINIWYCKI